MRHRVVISGLGALSPLGVGVGALWNGLKASRSGLRYSEKLGSVVGEVPDFPSERWSRGEQREMSRGSQFALLAAEECLQDAKLGNDDAENTGVNIGMGIADLEMIEETAELIRQGKAKRVTPYFVPRILTNMPAGYVSMKYGLKGGNMSSTTACATGASCVGDAATMVALGRVRRMIAGAVESCVNPIAITGFNRLRALARGQTGDISRPFDKTREGFVLSEGGAVVLLERLEDARTRGAPIYAEVLGYGISSDAYHLTSPDESGIGGRLCMGRSLEDAAVKGQEVSYVNAHATSTPMGDRIEAKSIASVCPSVAASSIK
uniref:beta-ketoacyl-[acyl-carrier-protein] synthase I n=1 Tax=Steinernema glaseri TaxID=37863 RepID=A0A1I8ABP6_9BILA